MSSTLEGRTSSLHCLSSTITAPGRPSRSWPVIIASRRLEVSGSWNSSSSPWSSSPPSSIAFDSDFSEFRQERTSLSGGFQP
jgi:hypothetical protein